MMRPQLLRTIIVAHAVLAGVLGTAVGCGSVSPLYADGGSAGGGSAGTSGQAGTTGQGGHGGMAGTGTGGQGGAAGVGGAGFCNADNDCTYRPGSCCNGSCAAKTDPLPPPGPVCNIACTASAPTCGCVNHHCATAPGDAGTDTRSDGGSSGSVTLRLVIPTSRSFCDQTTGCSGIAHITILDTAGQTLGLVVPWCSTICSTACTPSPCPAFACFNQGVPVETGDLTWDGSSYAGSMCGNNMACYQPAFAPAGHYVAHMCATPGNLTTADGGFPSTCTATGSQECVDVPFDYPGPSPVVGTLP
jgi:hypothetical protein